jgi:hypothetical protein
MTRTRSVTGGRAFTARLARRKAAPYVSFAAVIAITFGPEILLAQRGRAGGPPPSARASAPIDLTGYWVSLVTEDWRWRMVTAPKGDYPSIPLNAEGRRVADAWDPAKDAAAGEQCKAYGAANLMRVPTRLRVTWDNDSTLTIETDAGTQTRLFQFGRLPRTAGDPTWQGISTATWEYAGGRAPREGAAPRGGQLKVVTTGMRPGYLQRNGVPYSANAVVTEYFNRTQEPNGDSFLIVTTVVEDPQYLNTHFARSSHFKKEADGSKWSPTPCV